MTLYRVLTLLIVLWLPRAFADSRPDPNPAGSVLQPEGQTKVQMLRERVVLEVKPATTKPKSVDVAQVTADFYFKNQGKLAERMRVLFPVQSDDISNFYVGRNLRVWVNGAPVKTEDVKKRDGDHVYAWKGFRVSFPLGKEVAVRVQYDTYSLGLDETLNSFGYTFATGAAWFGKIGLIDLVVRLPFPTSRDNVWGSPPFAEYKDRPVHPQYVRNEVRWQWKNVEPEEYSYLELQTIPIWIWKSVLKARADVAATPQDVNAHLRLIEATASLNHWGYSIYPTDEYHDPRLERVCSNAFKLFPTELPLRFRCIQLTENEFVKDGVVETDPGIQFILRTLKDISTLSPFNPRAETLYGALRYDQEWMTLPLTPPITGSQGSNPNLTPEQTVSDIAGKAGLQAISTASCDAVLKEPRLRIYGDRGGDPFPEFKPEHGYSVSASEPLGDNLNAWKSRLEVALNDFGRSWISPVWGDLDEAKSWQVRWFSNLDGSRRYATAIRTNRQQSVLVCFKTFLRFVVKN